MSFKMISNRLLGVLCFAELSAQIRRINDMRSLVTCKTTNVIGLSSGPGPRFFVGQKGYIVIKMI